MGQAPSSARRDGSSATIESIRLAGFEVIPDASSNFHNHGRIVHRLGVAGFEDKPLEKRARIIVNVKVTES